MLTNKPELYDRTDEYIIMCEFGRHTISGYRVTVVGPPKLSPFPPPLPVSGTSKKPGLNRVKIKVIPVHFTLGRKLTRMQSQMYFDLNRMYELCPFHFSLFVSFRFIILTLNDSKRFQRSKSAMEGSTQPATNRTSPLLPTKPLLYLGEGVSYLVRPRVKVAEKSVIRLHVLIIQRVVEILYSVGN